MHTLIYVAFGVKEQVDPDTLPGRVDDMFTGRRPAFTFFDYGRPMTNESARFRQSVPDEARERGYVSDPEAIEAEINDGWKATEKNLRRALAVVRKGLDSYSDDEILGEDHRVEADVEAWNPLGLVQDESEMAGTYETKLRRAMSRLNGYESGDYKLYSEYGTALQTRSEVDDVIDAVHDPERDVYLVPLDVHY